MVPFIERDLTFLFATVIIQYFGKKIKVLTKKVLLFAVRGRCAENIKIPGRDFSPPRSVFVCLTYSAHHFPAYSERRSLILINASFSRRLSNAASSIFRSRRLASLSESVDTHMP